MSINFSDPSMYYYNYNKDGDLTNTEVSNDQPEPTNDNSFVEIYNKVDSNETCKMNIDSRIIKQEETKLSNLKKDLQNKLNQLSNILKCPYLPEVDLSQFQNAINDIDNALSFDTEDLEAKYSKFCEVEDIAGKALKVLDATISDCVLKVQAGPGASI